MSIIEPISEQTGLLLLENAKAHTAEAVKQTALMARIAQTTVGAALVSDWGEAAEAVQGKLGPMVFPIGMKCIVPWSTKASSSGTATEYAPAFNVTHHGQGVLKDSEILEVMHLQMDRCLPFDTPFSPCQAFVYAIDGLPAGTYNVIVASEYAGRAAGTYQFTLTQAVPAGGQLVGFWKAGAAASVTVYASRTTTTATETCAVTSGNGGVCLGTFSAAGDQVVPASGTPATSKTITVSGTGYHVYGLNSMQRVAYGNNRYLHSSARQYLGAEGFNWYVPQTVFDRPPAYAGRQGFLSGFSDEFLEHVQPIARKTAVSYLCDGGASGSPEYDTTYDLFALPSGKEHFLAATSDYGGAAGLEGDNWEYWERVAGSNTPKSWGGTYPEFIQYDLASPTTARSVWLRSAHRGAGHGVAIVYTSGHCNDHAACRGYRLAPACAIG